MIKPIFNQEPYKLFINVKYLRLMQSYIFSEQENFSQAIPITRRRSIDPSSILSRVSGDDPKTFESETPDSLSPLAFTPGSVSSTSTVEGLSFSFLIFR